MQSRLFFFPGGAAGLHVYKWTNEFRRVTKLLNVNEVVCTFVIAVSSKSEDVLCTLKTCLRCVDKFLDVYQETAE